MSNHPLTKRPSTSLRTPGAILILCAALATGCGDAQETTMPAPKKPTPAPVVTPPAPPAGVPALLSQTGLYADIVHGVIATGVEPYTPQFPLWSDGAQKGRWVRLPAGTQIDNSDQDHWSFPVGTRFYKNFGLNGQTLETRTITRTGTGASDFLFATYQWNAAGTDAEYVADGVSNEYNTGHDIPPVADCILCHGRIRENILGFGAIQLSQSLPGYNIAGLSQQGLLTQPAADGFQVPGDAVTQAALGYLHGNCGYCHNPDGIAFTTTYLLRLWVSQQTIEDTGAYQTAVGVPTVRFVKPGITYRVAPGDPDGSAVFYRMATRGDGVQMPPLASSLPDPTGLAAVRAWIDELPQQTP